MFELLSRAKTGEGVKSGPIGLAVILVLCVAAYFLFKSMSKHLKKVREEFPVDAPPPPAAPPAQTPAQTSVQAPVAPPAAGQAAARPDEPPR